MNEARILKGLLWIAQEAGGLGPAQLDIWLGKLKKQGYLDMELRDIDGYNLPHWIVTDEGREKLK